MADFQNFFNSAPDAYLVLRADGAFTIVAANETYLRIAGVDRAKIVGSSFFEAFRDNPRFAAITTTATMKTALAAVIASCQEQVVSWPDPVAAPMPDEPGESAVRYWRASNVPVLSADGTVQEIIHRLEDVSAHVRLEELQRCQQEAEQALIARAEAASQEARFHIDELARARDQLAANRRQLQESEARLEIAANAGEIATWIWEPQTDRLFADVNLARWFHVSPAEARGGSITALLQAVHPDDLFAVRDAIDRSLKSGSMFRAEYRISDEDGHWRWVVARGRVERDSENRPTRLVGVVIDVTLLRLTIQTLLETQERLHLAAEAAEIGCYSLSVPPGQLILNAQCKAHFWHPPDALVTLENFYSILHPDDREPIRKAIEDSINEHTPFDAEYRTVSPTGEIRWVHAKGRAYYDATGHATRFDGITIDTTQRKQIEAELRGSEARYRLLVESLHDYAVIMQDDAGRVTSWNTGAERLLGYSEEEILGRSTRIFFTPEDQAEGVPEKEIRAVQQTGRASDDRWHVRKDGSRFFVNGLTVALHDDQGRRVGFAKIMRDTTDRQIATAERERLLERERAARAEAERTSRLKDEFLATLSHELRTPLNAILGWTQILKEGPLEARELAQGLEVIDRNTRLQAQLIEDLLDMSRIVSGKSRLDFQRVDLAAIVRSAVESVHIAVDAKNIKLHTSGTATSALLMGDRRRLQQIVLNLLSNAVKFTPKEGSIAVSVESTATQVSVTVTDTGIGIHRDFLPHVFEQFRQADASTTRQHGGLGLGLAIVRQLVDLHGGQVQAHSEGEGKGAMFRVSLPRGSIESRAAETPAGTGKPAKIFLRPVDLSGVKVLVVDDEPDSAGLVKRVLEGCHAEVQAAGSMEEALKIFGSFHPHVLLSDIGMPRHDGYELLRRLRKLPGGEIPAAALTALARSEDVERARDAGFQAHVAKPVEPSELVSITASLARIAH